MRRRRMATGRLFTPRMGARSWRVYGGYNIDGEGPEAYLSHNVNLSDVTYKKIGSDFYAVSGARGANIYYERCNFPNRDVLSCFYVSYPATDPNWAILASCSDGLPVAGTARPCAPLARPCLESPPISVLGETRPRQKSTNSRQET